jgi:hypothetical protein
MAFSTRMPPSSPQLLSLHSRVIKLAQKRRLMHLLRTILASDERLADIASRSYRHANGFDKIVLSTDRSTGEKLRLHVWWPTDGAFEENIHNHRWDFATYILSGGYRTDFFLRSHTGRRLFEYRYRPVGAEEHYSLEPRGRVALEQVYSAVLSAGTSYTLDGGVLHRVLVDRQHFTMSLVVQSGATMEATSVFSPTRLQSDHSAARAPVTDLRERLAACLSHITLP